MYWVPSPPWASDSTFLLMQTRTRQWSWFKSLGFGYSHGRTQFLAPASASSVLAVVFVN